MVPLSLLLPTDVAASIIREAVQAAPRGGGGGGEGGARVRLLCDEVVRLVFAHWLQKRETRGHFLSQHHVVALQDLVAFLPGEWEQNKHKSPFYVKPTTAVAAASNKRKRPRLSAPRKSASSK
jgi:hypothetical protein